MRKSKVLLIGEASARIDTDVTAFACDRDVVALTAATAIVTRNKVGRIMAGLFLTFQRNPYPTRAFDGVDSARNWLLSLGQD